MNAEYNYKIRGLSNPLSAKKPAAINAICYKHDVAATKAELYFER